MIGSSISHFKITGKLGEGGMGEVYRAADTKLGRDVALKVLPEAFTEDAERMARFAREAQVLASLNHSNIASIYGLEEQAGQRALVMELVEGNTLQEVLERGALPLDRALSYALQIAEALEAAHEKGIVHRDLKPANVKITPEGIVKVLDFGLAKALEEERDPGDMANSPTLTAAATQAGIILGTAAYMSPEQAAGQLADRRADIWAFGVVLSEMLSGKKQFAGETVSHTLAAVLQKEPDWDELPDDLPKPMLNLLEHCLRKDVKRRLQAIGDARVQIQDYLADPQAGQAGTGLAAGSTTAQVPAWRKALPWAVAAVLLAAVIWLLVGELGGQPAAGTASLKVEVALSDQSMMRNLGSDLALSPDGRRLAFAVGGTNQGALILRSMNQLESTVLMDQTSGATPYHPFFSPNGEWIGFVTAGELKKVPVSGGTSITLCNVSRSRGATWALDNTIIFAPNPASGLFRVSAVGGEPEPLTELDVDRGEATHRWPQALPDGKSVLFTSYTQSLGDFNDASVEVLDLETKARKVVQRGGSYGRYVPTGHLVFVNNRTLFAVPFDLEKMEPVGGPAPVVQDLSYENSQGGAQFSFSDTGLLVYASGEDRVPTYPIVRVDREGRIEEIWQDAGTYGAPRLSRDGGRLALTVLRDANWDIWVFDLNRGVATRLTFHDGYDGDPVWSPDGQYVAFSSDRNGTDSIWRKRSDGSGEAEEIMGGEHAVYSESWSPEGRYLVGVRYGDQSGDIVYVDLEAGDIEPQTFLASEFEEVGSAISPNGRWIAYSSNESGRSEVYVRPFPGEGGRWQVSDGGGSGPVWSNDGREIFYRTDDGIIGAEVDIAGDTFVAGRPSLVIEGSFQGGLGGISIGGYGFPDFEVGTDGQYFVMFPEASGEARGAHVILVTNWFDELRQMLQVKGP